MKKAYIFIIFLVLMLFAQQITQTVDTDIQRELSRKSIDLRENPDAFILQVNEQTFEHDLKYIIDAAKEFDVNLMIQKSNLESANYVYYVYGEEFNNRNVPVLGERLDFTIKGNDYYTTDPNDTKGVLIPSYSELPLSINAYGEIMPSATEWHNLLEFSEEVNSNELDDVAVYYYGIHNNISGFTSKIKTNEMVDFGVEMEISYAKDNSVSIYTYFSLILLVVTFSYLVSKYESSRKKYSVLKLNGFSNAQILLKETMPSLLTIIVVTSILATSIVVLKYSYSLWLVKTALLCIAKILLLFVIIYSIQICILNMLIRNDNGIYSLKKSGNAGLVAGVNISIKIIVLVAFLPTILTNFTSFYEYSKESLRMHLTDERVKNYKTVSNEYPTMPMELIQFSNNEKKDIRAVFDSIGGIYFDTSFNKEIELLQIPEESKEDLESVYREFPRNVFETKLVVVNENYLREFPLIFPKGIEQEEFVTKNTILIPKSLETEIRNVQNNYCSGPCDVKIVPDFAVTNIEIETVPLKQTIKKTMVMIIGDSVDIKGKNREIDSVEFGTPFYSKFHFSEETFNKAYEYIREIDPSEEGIQFINNKDVLAEKNLEIQWWFNKLFPELLTATLLVVMLNIQSILSYFDVEGKRISIEQAHGYRRLQSARTYLYGQLILYLVPISYHMSGLYKKIGFNSLYTTRIGVEAYLIIFGLFLVADLSVMQILWHKVHKKTIDIMKGEG